MSRFNQTEEQKRQECGIINSFAIEHVTNGNYGIRFTLVINGVAINGVRIEETASGREFIALPSYKGKNGKYYNQVYFRFSDEDTERIFNELERILNEQ